MSRIAQVELGEYRGVYSYGLQDLDCDRGDYVILEEDHSYEFGKMTSLKQTVCEGKAENTKGKILRKATDGDLKQIENNRIKARDALNICVQKITERKLPMQMVKAEYTFDNSKVIFLFTADGRIDFRNLVKELARVFRVRIELKQIGVRDKAKIIGGYGVCGRELCCSSFLKGFHALSIKMAKDQQLPLNPSRISGVCGRIKCCMAYEFSVYKEILKSLPHIGEKITTPEGKGDVIEINVLKRYARVHLGEGKVVRKDFSQSHAE